MTQSEYIAYCYACECEGVMPLAWEQITDLLTLADRYSSIKSHKGCTGCTVCSYDEFDERLSTLRD